MAVHQCNPLAINPEVGKIPRNLYVLLLAGTCCEQSPIPVIVPEHPDHPYRDPSKDRDDEWRDVIPSMEHHVNLLPNERLHRVPGVEKVVMGVSYNADPHLAYPTSSLQV